MHLLLDHVEREKQAKQHQYILAKELHHRIQNLFTVIQGVIRFSLPGNGLVHAAAIRERLMDRSQSMSAANRAITDSMGDGVRLLDLIVGEIDGFQSRFEVTGGSSLVLSAQMTQDLSLVLHELVTNALKYGALSVPHGHIDLRLDWTDGILTFSWQERDGPTMIQPRGSGFGSRILGTFAKGFCRDIETSYDPSGLRYTLQIESDRIRCVEPSPGKQPQGLAQQPRSRPKCAILCVPKRRTQARSANRSWKASVPFPEFASLSGVLVCQLRNPRILLGSEVGGATNEAPLWCHAA